jgi:hypothetical protein
VKKEKALTVITYTAITIMTVAVIVMLMVASSKTAYASEGIYSDEEYEAEVEPVEEPPFPEWFEDEPPEEAVTTEPTEMYAEVPYTPTIRSIQPIGTTGAILPEIIERIPQGLEAIIVELFGNYEPIQRIETRYVTESHFVYDDYGYVHLVTNIVEVPEVKHGVNIAWITGVVFFGIVLLSFFKCIGGLIKWRV